MDRKLPRLAVVLSVTLLLLLALAASIAAAAPRAPGSPIWYVDDDTCPSAGAGTEGDPFCRIQDAVDAATAGDEVRVATGLYTGTQMVADSDGYSHTQVVFVDKDLTLIGGFDPPDWSTSNPERNVTTIDAERSGRGITLRGPSDIRVTIDGLTVTRGDYTGLGNPDGVGSQACQEDGGDCAGGIYAYGVALTLRNSIIFDNIGGTDSGEGGGIFLWELAHSGPTLIENTQIISNSAGNHQGGGLRTYYSSVPITVTGCVFRDNSAYYGGGATFYNVRAPLTIEDTLFLDNVAAYDGAGAWIRIGAPGADILLNRVSFIGNTAETIAALRLSAAGSPTPTFKIVNTIFARNTVSVPSTASGVLGLVANFTAVNLEMFHVTAADNNSPNFLYGRPHTSAGRPISISLTNTLVVSFTNAFVLEQPESTEAQLRHTNTFTDSVANLHLAAAGSPTFEAFLTKTGDARLDETYRLQANSDAIDRGASSDVTNDIDRQPRPIGMPDIGADEWQLVVFVPLVLRQE